MVQPAPQLAVLLRNMFCLRNDTISFTTTAAVHEDSFHKTGAKFARRGETSSSGTTFPRLLHSQPGSASSAFSAAEPLTPAGAAQRRSGRIAEEAYGGRCLALSTMRLTFERVLCAQARPGLPPAAARGAPKLLRLAGGPQVCYANSLCESGGTGRRTGLRIQLL